MKPFSLLLALAVMGAVYFWIVESNSAIATEVTEKSVNDLVAEQNDGTKSTMQPVSVVAFASKARPIESIVHLRGRTEAHRKVDVRAETPGLVISQPLRAGSEVTKGDLLCELDAGSRAAALAESKASLVRAQTEYAATTRLSEKGFAADVTAKAREAALEAAKARVNQVELDILRLQIRAPFDGILETDSAELGSLLSIGDSCATVIALNPIKLVGYAPETEIDRLQLGGIAGGRLVSGTEIGGIITFISRSADPLTRTFRVEVTADNSDGSIRDGMSAEILVPLSSGFAHLAPHAALTLSDAGELGIRAVINSGDVPSAAFMPVSILRDDLGGVWLGGLPKEVNIIVVGQEYVSDGRAVTPTFIDWKPQAAGDL